MKNTRRFGKVRTQEEYLIYCRLEKAIKHDKRKKQGRNRGKGSKRR
ncbi:hypothetical protein O0Z71_05960 [Ligilactobacillus saerimneri]|nr:hypothetical protein [Ligilactobacillus saerimneri]MCZ0891984.1 hypothetical protein [Ligilactobacillus saerimneri]